MIIDYKKITDTNIDFYRKTYIFDETHHLARMVGEHYKLLTYLSYKFDDILILDVGTAGGESSVALSQNPKNRVITYDIAKKWEIEKTTTMINHFLEDYSNLEFRLKDINEEDEELIKSAKIIFFDIAHDGFQEKRFTDTLLRIGFKGFLICDDMHAPFYPNMIHWWNSIQLEKYDLTDIGHTWGSGLVNYSNEKIEIIKNN